MALQYSRRYAPNFSKLTAVLFMVVALAVPAVIASNITSVFAADTGVATNVKTGITYDDMQVAIDAAADTNTIRLEKDIVLDTLSIRITKSLIIDGNHKTVRTTFNRGPGGVSNAAFIVLASNTILKNVTIAGNGTGTTAAHGIVTDAGLNGIILQNITARDGAAAVIINGSKVAIDTIHTSNNNWYGINVDRTDAALTIKGVNSHTEPVAIRSADTTGSNAAVIDADRSYTKLSAAPANGSVYIRDTIAPTQPVITSPGARTWHKTAPITSTWMPATDANGVATYQVEYIYDDGHTFSGGPYREVPGSQTSRAHSPAISEQGGVTIRVRAIDYAGNVSTWSNPVHYYYDASVPTTNINVSQVVDGKFTVSGVANDNIALNRVYVQLVSRVTSGRCGGTTINLIGQGKNVNWNQEYDIATIGCPEGQYAAHVSVVDMAGNTSSAGWTDNFLVTEDAERQSQNYPSGSLSGAEQQNPITTGGNINPQTIVGPVVAFNNINEPVVLGEQDTAEPTSPSAVAADIAAEQEVKGESDINTNGNLNFIGIAWYWWLLALAAIAGLWWLLAALRDRDHKIADNN